MLLGGFLIPRAACERAANARRGQLKNAVIPSIIAAIRVRWTIFGFSLVLLAGCGTLGADLQQALTPKPVEIIEADLSSRLRALRIGFAGYTVRAVESRLPGIHGKSAAISLIPLEGSGVTLHLPLEYNYRFDEHDIPRIVYHPSDDELRRSVDLAIGSFQKVYASAIEAFKKQELMPDAQEGAYQVSLTMLSLDPARPKTARWHVNLSKGETEIAGVIVNGYSGETDEVVAYE